MDALILLGLRRALPWSLAGLALLATWFAASGDAAWVREHEPGSLAGLLRARAFAAGALLLLPTLLLPAAAFATRHRREESDWLGPRGAAGTRALGLRLGISLGSAFLLLLALGLAAEPRAGRDEAYRRVARVDSPGRLLEAAGGSQEEALELALPAVPFDVLRLRVSVLPGSGPTADVVLSLDSGGRIQRHLAGPTRLQVEAPGGATRLRLERVSPGAVVLVPRGGVELLARAEGAPGLHLALALAPHVLLAVSLAFLAGFLVRPALAFLVSLAPLRVAPWSAGLADLRDGLLAAPPAPWLGLLALLLPLAGLALLESARRRRVP